MKDLLLVVKTDLYISGNPVPMPISASLLASGVGYSGDPYEDVDLSDEIAQLEERLEITIDIGGTETNNVYEIDLDVLDIDDQLPAVEVSAKLNEILNVISKKFV